MIEIDAGIFVYWFNEKGPLWIDYAALISIGFLIYGPIMLIGVQALDLVPKKAAGTAAGLTGFFGYVGGALFANIAIGYVVDNFSWDAGFWLIVLACVFSIFFTALTWKREQLNIKL